MLECRFEDNIERIEGVAWNGDRGKNSGFLIVREIIDCVVG